MFGLITQRMSALTVRRSAIVAVGQAELRCDPWCLKMSFVCCLPFVVVPPQPTSSLPRGGLSFVAGLVVNARRFCNVRVARGFDLLFTNIVRAFD